MSVGAPRNRSGRKGRGNDVELGREGGGPVPPAPGSTRGSELRTDGIGSSPKGEEIERCKQTKVQF